MEGGFSASPKRKQSMCLILVNKHVLNCMTIQISDNFWLILNLIFWGGFFDLLLQISLYQIFHYGDICKTILAFV